jgi:hypothetical protein
VTVPPLLALAASRRVRPRKAAVPRPKELAMHMAVADVLKCFARSDWRWGHYPPENIATSEPPRS